MAIRKMLKWVLVGRPEGYRARLRRRVESCVAGEVSPEPVSEVVAEPAVSETVEAADVPSLDGFDDVMSADELADGEVVEVAVGDDVVAISKVDGVHHVVDNICPHAGGPLGDGDMEEHDVVCPYHGWAFDVRTGECNVAPDMAISVHEVQVSGGRVYVRVGAPA